MKLAWKTLAKRVAVVGAVGAIGAVGTIGTAYYFGMRIKNEFGLQTARIEQFPWHAAVVNIVAGQCSGFLIEADWVLTAAHCVPNHHYDTTIRTGSKQMSGGDSATATYVIRHANYPRHWDPTQPQHSGDWPSDFDIALVHMDKPADPKKTSIIQRIDVREAEVYTDAFISGWVCSSNVAEKIRGFLSKDNPCNGLVYTDLRPLMKLQASGFCHERDRFICAVGPPDKRSGFDYGDSGGALTTGTIAGAHAMGIAIFVRKEEADVYLRLSSYEDWIKRCKADPNLPPRRDGVKTIYTECQ